MVPSVVEYGNSSATEEGVYAVWPSRYATSMLGMLQKLGGPPDYVKQYWVYLTKVPNPNEQNGGLLSGWDFAGVADLNPELIPGG